MQYTDHYNLNLPEGSDIVNPLVQDNPNYTTIDGALYANKVRTVGNATEVKSGTVHAITRNDSDIDVIRFTATGDWIAGDTMTVDGTPVSVYLPDGAAPLSGAYVINSEVVAVINGSRVTLLVNNPVALPPTPTAGDISYDNNGSGLTASNVQDAIDEVEAQVTSITGARGYIFPVTNIDVNIATGSMYRSNGILCNVGESLSGKAVCVSAEGLGWANGISISGSTVTVNIGRPSAATDLSGTIHIIVCDV